MIFSKKIIPIVTILLLGLHSKGAVNQENPFMLENVELKVYPIPVTDNEVNLESDVEITNIEILNILGQTVYKEQYTGVNKIKIQLEINESGLYIFQIKTRNGRMTTKRILVK